MQCHYLGLYQDKELTVREIEEVCISERGSLNFTSPRCLSTTFGSYFATLFFTTFLCSRLPSCRFHRWIDFLDVISCSINAPPVTVVADNIFIESVTTNISTFVVGTATLGITSIEVKVLCGRLLKKPRYPLPP
jgi:hypothetical protein